VTQSLIALFTGLLSIPILIAINGLFVMAEFSLVAVRRTRVKELVGEGAVGARAFERATATLDRSLAATQLGVTLSSLGLGWLGEPALASALAPAVSYTGVAHATVVAHSIAFGIAFLAIAFVHIVLGELAPRSLALRAPDRVGLLLVPPLEVFERLARPFTWLLSRAGAAVVRLLGVKGPRQHSGEPHSVAELTLLVEASERAGVLERREREMVQGVLAFGEMTVHQIMVPKDQITGIRVGDTPERIIQAALESGYSRLPAWETGPEDIVGVLNVKDMLSFISETEQGLMVVQDLVREPSYVRTSTRLLDLLQEFQRGDHHLALVLDDFGELAGLVTLEDLLEEIVGEIRDEYDLSEDRLKLDREGNVTAAGDLSCRDVLADLKIAPPAWASGTLADFLLYVNKEPLAVDATVTYGDHHFTVLEVSSDGLPRKVRIVKAPRSA